MLRPNELQIAAGAPPAACSLAEAQKYTRRLATHHYENFNVASWLLPAELHQHFYNLYAYCRWADDLGDEIPDPRRALELLDWWEQELDYCYAGTPQHPVFVAEPEHVAFGGDEARIGEFPFDAPAGGQRFIRQNGGARAIGEQARAD